MWSFTGKHLRAGWGRLLIVGFSLLAAGAFLTVTLILPAPLRKTATDVVARDGANAAYAVTLNEDVDPYESLDAISETAPSSQLDTTGSIQVQYPNAVTVTELFASTISHPFRRYPLVAGREPENRREVALTVNQARAHSIGIGSTITVTLPLTSVGSNWPTEDEVQQTATELGMEGHCDDEGCWLSDELNVVGLAASVPSFLGGFDRMTISWADIHAWQKSPTQWIHQNRILICHEDAELEGLDYDILQRTIPGVLTIQSEADLYWSAAQVTSQRSILPTTVFGVLTVLAFLVSLLVIDALFHTHLLRNYRDFVLLRRLGAQPRQLAGLIRSQALVVGLIAGIAGVLAGGGLTSAIMAFLVNNPALSLQQGAGLENTASRAASNQAASFDWELPPPTWQWPLAAIIVPPLMCAIVTLFAVHRATRYAAAADPLDAIGDYSGTTTVGTTPTRIPRLRRALAVFLLVAPICTFALCIWLGPLAPAARSNPHTVPWTIYVAGICTLLFFIGLLLSIPSIAPRMASSLVRSITRLLPRRLHPVTRLASGHIERFPRRTARAAAVLAIASGVVMTLSTAADSVQKSVSDQLDNVFSFDLEIYPPPTAPSDPEQLLEQVRSLPGVTEAVFANQAFVTVRYADGQQRLPIMGINQVSALLVSRDPQIPASLEPGVLLAGKNCPLPEDITEVEVITKGRDELVPWHTQSFSVVHTNAWFTALVTDDDFASVQAAHVSPVVVASVSPRDYSQVATSVQTLFAPHQQTGNIAPPAANSVVRVAGAATVMAALDKALEILLIIVVGLLMAAVIIAFLGVASSLLISAGQRHAENSLLHTVGMTTAQLRISVILESTAVFVVGAMVGLATGMGIGVVCSWMVLTSVAIPPLLSLPWSSAGILLGVCLIGGLLAAFVPALWKRKPLTLQR